MNICPHCNEPIGAIGPMIFCSVCNKDIEGYTIEERMKRRHRREMANAPILDIVKTRAQALRRATRPSRDPMPGRVVGSVRTSRPIFGGE